MYILISLAPLKNKLFAIVDIADRDLATQKWYGENRPDFKRYARKSDRTKAFMHRIILSRMLGRNLKRGEVADHIDGNGLNNKRSNLRLATYRQNGINRSADKNSTSKYKGVSYIKSRKKWAAAIKVNDIQVNLGQYDDEKLAAQVYDAAARKYFNPEFRYLNFPNETFTLEQFGIRSNILSPCEIRSDNKTGYRGVTKFGNKFRARAMVNGQDVSLGIHDTPKQASLAIEKYKSSF